MKKLFFPVVVFLFIFSMHVSAQGSLKIGLATGASDVKTSDSSGSLTFSGKGTGIYIGFDYPVNPYFGIYLDCPFTFGNKFNYDDSGSTSLSFDNDSSYFDFNFAGGAYLALPLAKNRFSFYAGAGISVVMQSCKWDSGNSLESLYGGEGLNFKGGIKITPVRHFIIDSFVSDSVNFITLSRYENMKTNGQIYDFDLKNSTNSFGNFFTFTISAGYTF
jgi:hypothetical protein